MLNDNQKDILAQALYSYVGKYVGYCEAGVVSEAVLEADLETVVAICQASGIDDQVQAYLTDQAELKHDQALYRAECEQANL